MKTTKITFFGGFHNSNAATIRVSNETANDIREGFYPLYELLSDYQLRRLNRHFCGVEGCICGGVMRASVEA